MTLILPAVIGHRGACGHAPENTLASFRKASELGAKWVEFDVRFSLDGALVVFHDERLERTTNGLGLVAKTELAKLQSLDAGSWFASEFKCEIIPTLEQTVALLERLGLGANVEFKQDGEPARAAAHFLSRHWPSGMPTPLISSFLPDALRQAAAIAPQIPRALCIDELPKDWRERLDDFGGVALHCRGAKLKPRQASAVLGAGFALRCYTVNRLSQARKLFGLGVNAVFSDFPERIAE